MSNTPPRRRASVSVDTIVQTMLASAASAGLCAMAVMAWKPALAQPVLLTLPPQLLGTPARVDHQREPYEPVVSHGASSLAGTFNSGMIFIADQLDRVYHAHLRTRPTVITSFVNLNDLAETSGLGRLVGEHLLHELQIRSWAVTDIRLTKDVVVNERGEFSLSRDMKHLRESFPVANIVTGTYSTTVDGVLLSVRIIDSASGHVISTAQTRFMRDRFINGLIDKAPATPAAPAVPTIKLTAACPAGLVCSTPGK